MRWFDSLRLRLRTLFQPSRQALLLDRELRFHLDQQIAENLAAGMAPELARQEALRTFGNPLLLRQQTHGTWHWTACERIAEDVRFALRQMRRAPGFAVTAVLILTLGIGANTAIFSLTHGLLLSGLPVPSPGQLVRITVNMHDRDPVNNNAPISLPMIEALEARAHSFEGIFGWSVYDFVLRTGTYSHGIHGATVGGNAFQVLGVQPALGRLLEPADDRPGGGPEGFAAVLSHRAWVNLFHADPAVLGRHILITDHPVVIVGVAPQGFEGVLVAEHPDIYLPVEFDGALNTEAGLHHPGHFWLTTFARLRPGVSRAQAAAEVAALFPSILDQQLPPAIRHLPEVMQSTLEVYPAGTGWSPLRVQYTQPLLLLQLLVFAVLLICCANLSGLFLARAVRRQQEFAIRGALGAPRSRLLRQLLVESLLLAIPGAVLGIVLAWLAGPLLLHALGSRQAEESLSARPNLPVLAVTALSAVCCAVLFGMAPAWTATRFSVEASLRGSNRSSTRRGGSVQRFFVPFQIALSLALVVVAALLADSVVRLRTQNFGFHTARVSFYLADFNRLPQKGADLVAVYRRVAARIAAAPGIESASIAEIPPLLGWRDESPFGPADDPLHAAPIPSEVNAIGADYLATVGTPLVAGRDLRNTAEDDHSCLLNLAAAQRYFPGRNPLGQLLQQTIHDFEQQTTTTRTYQVVGLTANSKYDNLRTPDPAIVYLPVTGTSFSLTRLFFVIRGVSTKQIQHAYQTALHEFAPSSPETDPFQFAQQLNDSIASEQLVAGLSSFFAVLALLLSVIGIYGMLSASVSERTPEIGLRLALGASRERILWLILRQVGIILAIGLSAGALAAVFAARAIRSFLFEVTPASPAVFLTSALVLVAFAALAAILPTRRAIHIDPMEALRTE